jgi:ParB family transcriptional regulator, chromosome partitioning protein
MDKKNKKIVLGRGLHALIPQKIIQSNGPLMNKTAVVELDLEKIKPNQNQPRVIFDQDKIEELSRSIKSSGLIQPILVRAYDDGYQIIAGERRYRAMKFLNEKKIPAIVKETSEEKSILMALVENLQREDLNPIEEGETYSRLIKDYQYTQESLAEEIGKSRSAVANAIRLLKLSSEIKKFLIDKSLSMGHVRCLLAEEDVNKQLFLAKEAVDKKLSVRELEELVYSKNAKEKGKQKENKTNETGEKPVNQDPDIRMLIEKLQNKYGCKINLQGRLDQGVIQFEYHSKVEFNRLFEILGGFEVAE